MKQGKIYMKAWLDLHGRAKVLATDHWYLEFANLLLPVVSESYLYKSETQESQNQVTLMLTLYLEDCVTDGGNASSSVGIKGITDVTCRFMNCRKVISPTRSIKRISLSCCGELIRR